jgi:hypothetical protein
MINTDFFSLQAATEDVETPLIYFYASFIKGVLRRTSWMRSWKPREQIHGYDLGRDSCVQAQSLSGPV